MDYTYHLGLKDIRCCEQSLSSSSCMADRQRNGVKSFVNSVCCYGRQPVKTNSFDQIMEMQALL